MPRQGPAPPDEPFLPTLPEVQRTCDANWPISRGTARESAVSRPRSFLVRSATASRSDPRSVWYRGAARMAAGLSARRFASARLVRVLRRPTRGRTASALLGGRGDEARVAVDSRTRPGNLSIRRLGSPARGAGLPRCARRQRPADAPRTRGISSARRRGRASLPRPRPRRDRRVLCARGCVRAWPAFEAPPPPPRPRRVGARRVGGLSGQYLLYGYWDIAQRESFFDWFMLPSVALQIVAHAPSARPYRARLMVVVGALSVVALVRQADVSRVHAGADRSPPLGRRDRLDAQDGAAPPSLSAPHSAPPLSSPFWSPTATSAPTRASSSSTSRQCTDSSGRAQWPTSSPSRGAPRRRSSRSSALPS